MSIAQIIDGKGIAEKLREDLAAKIKREKIRAGLAVILVGEDPASQVYVRNKIAACEKAGIRSFEHKLPATATKEQILGLIALLNGHVDVSGILLQLPLPGHLNAADMIAAIDPAKDVDGLHPVNAGLLMQGRPRFIPCTPQGCLHLIHTVEKNIAGANALVIGRSVLFGKPMAQLLLNNDCTVTQAHSKTKNLPDLCRQADILVAAIGDPDFVKGSWIKPGAIVIDGGINRRVDGKLCGDVDYKASSVFARAITPVPGGVGPMTIACLLANTVKAAQG